MSGLDSLSPEMHSLMSSACDDLLTPEEAARLETACDTESQVRALVDYLQLDAELSLLLHGEDALDRVVRALGTDSARTNLSQASLPPARAGVSGLTFVGNTVYGTGDYLSAGWPVAYLVATAILGIALLVGSLVPVSEPVQVAGRSSVPSWANAEPKMEPVARITGMVDCRWETGSGFRVQGSGTAISKSPNLQISKSLVSLGDKFALISGLMEITYHTGAKVILQGPVTYEVESPGGGFLSLGKLTARVENAKQQAAISKSPNLQISKLFVVRTPTATITDLGTEFGVEVDKRGETTSHVIRGLVKVQIVTIDGKAQGTGQLLRENESARVEGIRGNCRIVVVPRTERLDFIREIPKRTIKMLDLVDVVAGGDGFSARRNRGIDPTNGRTTDTLGKPERDSRDYLVGDGHYHRVEALPFVDGVFIPDGRSGKVQVDSAGHVFEGCPDSANNTTSGHIWAGGVIPGIPTQLGGVDYSSPGHGVLFLHANKGITFDLAAIRRANPAHKLLRFRAVAGDTDLSGGTALADLWVLVDGEIRFSRWQINSTHGAFSVAVPIGENDRFLTLAATDGNGNIGIDWTMFCDPRLELLPAKTNHGTDTNEH